MLEHTIRLRAFSYAQREMAHGHSVQDWLEAEAELLSSTTLQLCLITRQAGRPSCEKLRA